MKPNICFEEVLINHVSASSIIHLARQELNFWAFLGILKNIS